MIAFLCTGTQPKWSPLCDVGDLVILVIVATVVGGTAAWLASKASGGSTLVKTVVGALVFFVAWVVTFMIGFRLEDVV